MLKSKYVGTFFILFLYLLVFFVFSAESYYIKGNLHDLWIPHIGAYSIKTGVVLHEGLHTSFGFIYSYLNYISLLLIESFPEGFSTADMILLSSVLFSGFTAILFVGLKLSSRNLLDSIFILSLLLSIVFQLRDVSKPLDYNDILWYGSYNSHLWAVLLIQIISVMNFFSFLKVKEVHLMEKLDRVFWFFIILQFVCVFVALNYKINFFLASLAVASSIFFFLSNRLKAIYLASALALLTVSLLVVSRMFNYSYMGYFQDIFHAVQSKKEIPFNCITSLFIFLYLYGALLFESNAFFIDFKALSSKGLFSYICIKVKSFKDYAKENLQKVSARIYMTVSIGLGLFVAIIGDWQKPNVYFVLVILLFICMSKVNAFLKRVSYVLISAFILTNCFSYAFMLIPKSNMSQPSVSEKEILANKISPFRAVKVVNKKRDFLIKNYIGLEDFYSIFSSKTDDPDFFLQISSTYKQNKEKWSLPFSNIEYKAMIDDAYKKVRDLGYEVDDDIMMLEFVNHLPLVLGTRIPEGSYHWIHIGTTFSYQNVDKILKLYEQAEAIYVPIISTDGQEQTYLNCTFYNWNFENDRFILYSSSRYGSLFVSREKAGRVKNLKALSYSASILKSNCEDFLKAPY